MPHVLRRSLIVCALFAVSACSSAVEVDSPELDRAERTACDELLDRLPEELEGLDRAEISPEDAPARAWGDPAVVVTCGVTMPDDFDEMSPCEQINDVGWFVRPEEYADDSSALDMTSIGFTPAVNVVVPADHRPPTGVLVAVSDAVSATLERTGSCA